MTPRLAELIRQIKDKQAQIPKKSRKPKNARQETAMTKFYRQSEWASTKAHKRANKRGRPDHGHGKSRARLRGI